jgi:two-component system CheB/CheR fusion protein
LTGSIVRSPADALIAIEDITAQKRAEAALREEIARRDEFIAVLSHELRNPLSPIRSSLFVLEAAEPGGEPAHKALAIIDRQVDHLTRIVDDLLDVARIVRGKVSLHCEQLELGEIARRTADDHRVSFDTAGVTLEVDCGPAAAWVCADPTRLIQVIGNLLTNALKFTPRGGRVELLLRAEGERAVLSVRDTGMGIEPGTCEQLFEPFMQGPQSLDRTRGGLGLGLAMVKGLVRLHGGSVAAASPGLGHGACFSVRLPLAPQPAHSTPPRHAIAGSPRRVLVIEDNLDAAEGLRALLALQGHEVQLAFDGRTGIELARRERPDIVLCDIGLPGMDGYAVARAIRTERALGDTFLVALSGYARPEDRKLAVEAGFDCHIAKPPSLQQLRELGRARRSE